MPLYDFTLDSSNTPRAGAALGGPRTAAPAGPTPSQFPPGAAQLGDLQGGMTDLVTPAQVGPAEVQEFLVPGLRALDEAMKLYWSGIRIPTKDSYRFMRVKIAGGNKSLMIWTDDLQNGRARLPVASLNQGKLDFNKDKYSPAYLPMAQRFLTRAGDRAVAVYRPVPVLVDYTMTIWSEFKRDAGYALHQIITRFHSLAEFRMSDGHLVGNVQLRYGGATPTGEVKTNFDQEANVKYDVSMTAEAWLPLPVKAMPTVLGHIRAIRETTGTVLAATLGQQTL